LDIAKKNPQCQLEIVVKNPVDYAHLFSLSQGLKLPIAVFLGMEVSNG